MDKERIIKLLKEIKDLVNDLQDIIDIPLEVFLSDIRNRYSVRHLIVEIVEVASNIGLIILREKFSVREVMGYSDIFKRLSDYAVLDESTGKDMERLAKLRNLIIHRYWEIDDARIYIEAKDKGINIIRNFMVEVEKYVSRR